MNRLLKVSIIIVAILFLAVLSYSFLNKPAIDQIDQKFAVPSSLSSAVAYKSDSFISSNGTSFVAYNYNDGESQILGPDSSLGTVDSTQISANKDFILFHEIGASGGLLSKVLSENNVASSPFGYWWVYDVQTQSLHVFANSLSLKFDGNSVYSLQQDTAGENITVYSLSNFNLTKTINILSSSEFMPISSGLVLQTTDNKIYYTTNGAVNNLIATNADLVAAFNNGTVFSMNKNDNELTSYDVRNSGSGTIAQNVVGQPLWNGTTGILYTTSNNLGNNNWQAHYYDSFTKKSVLWKLLSNVGELGGNSLKPIALFGSRAALVNDTSGKYYLIGSGLANFNSTNL